MAIILKLKIKLITYYIIILFGLLFIIELMLRGTVARLSPGFRLGGRNKWVKGNFRKKIEVSTILMLFQEFFPLGGEGFPLLPSWGRPWTVVNVEDSNQATL